MFEKTKPVLDKINFIQCVEVPLWSKEYQIGGKVDTIGNYSNTLSVIDYKSSLKPKKREYIQNYFLQTTAYSLMFEERTRVSIDQIVIIVADETGGVETFVESRGNFVNELMECLAEYRQITNSGAAN